jgi:hypothetical protein
MFSLLQDRSQENSLKAMFRRKLKIVSDAKYWRITIMIMDEKWDLDYGATVAS